MRWRTDAENTHDAVDQILIEAALDQARKDLAAFQEAPEDEALCEPLIDAMYNNLLRSLSHRQMARAVLLLLGEER